MAAQQMPSFEEVNPPEAAAAIEAGDGLLVDVREPGEWLQGRAAPARHIPLRQLSSRIGELPRDEPIYLICATGNRSRVAAMLLQRAGFARPINVRGGTLAWLRAGLPMIR